MKQAQVLSERDVKRVLAAIARRSYCNRDRAMFMLSYLAGMRVGEIAALRVSDVCEADGTVKAQIRLASSQTKGSEARTVLLNAAAQEELRVSIGAIASMHRLLATANHRSQRNHRRG